MANFLMDGVKTMLTTALVKKAAGLFGMQDSKLTSVIGRFLPVIIGALISKGKTSSGAGGILDLIKGGGYDKEGPDLMDVFSNKEKSDGFLKQGADLMPAILGNRQGGIMEKLMGMTGLGKGMAGTAMKFLLPVVMGKLGSVVSGKNLNADGLSSYLQDQKSSIANMGIGNMFDDGASTSKNTTSHTEERSGGGGFMKFLLPLLLLLGALWFFSQKGCNSETTTSDTTTTEVKTTSHDGHDHSTHDGHDHSSHDGHNHGTKTTNTKSNNTTTTNGTKTSKGFSLNAKGDIVDGNGKIVSMANSWSVNNDGSIIDLAGNTLVGAGTYSKSFMDKLKAKYGALTGTKYGLDANKNLVDGNGKVLYKYGDYIEQDGFFKDKNNKNIAPRLSKFSVKVGKMLEKAGDAIGNAADKTVESMKSLFAAMVTKKEGSSSNYTLSNIEFDKENNRITNFSKAEVEGLAAALKANPDGKIKVINYTTDGKSDAENKKLSKSRAQVVHDMLVTLGVKNRQISFKGGGSTDAAKAKGNSFEIVID